MIDVDGDLFNRFSTKDLEEFQENLIWKAFLQVIKDRIEIVRNELEVGRVKVIDKSGAKTTVILTHEDIKRRQGECSGLRYLIQLPDIVKEIKEQGEQTKE